MPVTAEEFVRVLDMLAKDEKQRVKVREKRKVVLTAVTGATIGGFMGGPLGMTVGAMAGSLAAWMLPARRLKHVHDVLQEMNPGERHALYDAFREKLRLDCNDVNTLTLLASSDDVVRAQMIDGLENYIIGTLHIQIYKNALGNPCTSPDVIDIPI